MRATRSIVLPAALAFAIGGTARASVHMADHRGANPGTGRDAASVASGDAAIVDQVRQRIARYPLYSVFDDVHAVVDHGTVTLEGDVTMGFKAFDIAREVEAIPGVRKVRNLVQTLPASTLDDALRVEVADSIYGDPLFETYAHRVDPPIHVVVDGGEVTLTGAVSSEVERLKAEIDARDVVGVMSVDNHLLVAS